METPKLKFNLEKFKNNIVEDVKRDALMNLVFNNTFNLKKKDWLIANVWEDYQITRDDFEFNEFMDKGKGDLIKFIEICEFVGFENKDFVLQLIQKNIDDNFLDRFVAEYKYKYSYSLEDTKEFVSYMNCSYREFFKDFLIDSIKGHEDCFKINFLASDEEILEFYNEHLRPIDNVLSWCENPPEF